MVKTRLKSTQNGREWLAGEMATSSVIHNDYNATGSLAHENNSVRSQVISFMQSAPVLSPCRRNPIRNDGDHLQKE